MDTNSYTALSIAISDSTNHILKENKRLTEENAIFMDIIRKLSNESSLLTKIMSIIRITESYSLYEVIIDKEALTVHDIIASYTEVIDLIPTLQTLGFHIIQYHENNEFDEMIYITWNTNICPVEREIANRKDYNIHEAKKIFKHPIVYSDYLRDVLGDSILMGENFPDVMEAPVPNVFEIISQQDSILIEENIPNVMEAPAPLNVFDFISQQN
tara:strand:- start:3355 stop:3996 length:642 start_codon:yes stop_codon:yes gene_type:complete